MQIELDYPYQPTSAVLKRKVRAENGLTYAVKGKTNNADFTPVNEWVCAKIARSIGIPIPPFGIILDRDGTYLFGSEWAAGQLKSHTMHYRSVEDPSIYSAILVFDLIILNQDRHMGNYLITEVDNRSKLLAFDHSHALLHNVPLPKYDVIIPPNSAYFHIIKDMGLVPDKRKMEITLAKFLKLKIDFFEEVISDCNNWLDTQKMAETLDWLSNRSLCETTVRGYIGGL